MADEFWTVSWWRGRYGKHNQTRHDTLEEALEHKKTIKPRAGTVTHIEVRPWKIDEQGYANTALFDPRVIMERI